MDCKRLEQSIDPFDQAVAGIAFGSSDFVRLVRARLAELKHPTEYSGLHSLLLPKPIPVEKIRWLVESICCTLSPCKKGQLFVYALRRFSGLTGRQIAILTDRSPQSVTAAWQNLECKRKTDSNLQELLQLLERAALEMTRSD